MKYEGQTYVGTKDDPAWFVEFAKHYNVVIKFLTQFNTGRFSMGVDVNMNTKAPTARISHGVETSVSHGMGITPTRAIVTGRVDAVYVREINTTSVTLTAKLLSTGVLPDYSGLSLNTVLVEDPTLFRVGDGVKWGQSTKVITGINGNKVSFNSEVTRGTVNRMILSQDEVRLTVF
jgi:hypothetical protein